VHTASVFVGRERELAALLAGLEEALLGRGALFLVGGEAGAGKSRLVDEFAGRARARGARCAWGRCWEAGGSPPYWPWVQPVRSLLQDGDRDALRAQMGAGACHLARMVPEVRELFPDLPAAPALEADEARFQLFDSAARFLKNAAKAQPLVLVLDDLHAADTPSLLLLRFLAGALSDAHLLVVGTYRDTELGPAHPLSSTVAELEREPVSRSLTLGGFSRPDVARFIEMNLARKPRQGLVAAVYAKTEGNPLFVNEVLRLLEREGRLEQDAESAIRRLGIPAGLRQVIGRRLGHLSRGCVRILGLASVLGREFGLGALERLSATGATELLEILGEAADSRLVAEVPGSPGRLRFSHALVRDALYEGLGASTRMQLHLQMCEVLEALHPDPEPHLAELAWHSFEAAPAAGIERAVGYARRAGDRALQLLAYEEAARLYRMALEALTSKEPWDEVTECDLRNVLGETQMRAGEVPAAKDSFRAAAAIARRLKLPEALARAALGYGGRFAWAAARGDHFLLELLDAASALLGEAPSGLRSRVLARLAAALRDSPPQRARRASLSEQAVAVARQVGDAAALAYALEVRTLIVYGPDAIEERLALATEMLRLAEVAGDRERRLQAHHWRLMTFFELGDARSVESEAQAQTLAADELGQPAQLWYAAVTRALHALFKGRFEGAAGLIAQARQLGARAQSWNAGQSFWLQTFALRRELGGFEDVEATVYRLIDENPTVVYWRCVLALLLCELGRETDARTTFEGLAAGGFGELPRDEDWLLGMTLLAEVCAQLGDTRRAAALYDLLLPYAERIAVSPPNLSTGCVSRSLGLLLTTLSRFDEAEWHFRGAQEAHARMDGRPWFARTQHDQARMLLRRGGPDDRRQALELFSEALATFRALGMAPLERSAATRREELLAETGAPPRAVSPPHANLFRREGEYWSVAYQGKLLRLKDAKGVRYVARLLREPGREFHALDLALEGEAVASGGAGAVLDPKAKAAYRRRLAALEAELAEATSWADQGRAARAGEERDFLVQELAKAVGLGGRNRVAASEAERARVNVTRAVKNTLARLREHNPQLGRHLDRTIRTGVFCSYQPDPQLQIHWAVHAD
jgi:hypothetical protein